MEAVTTLRLSEFPGDEVDVFRPTTGIDRTVLLSVRDGQGRATVVTFTPDEALALALLLLQGAAILTEGA